MEILIKFGKRSLGTRRCDVAWEKPQPQRCTPAASRRLPVLLRRLRRCFFLSGAAAFLLADRLPGVAACCQHPVETAPARGPGHPSLHRTPTAPQPLLLHRTPLPSRLQIAAAIVQLHAALAASPPNECVYTRKSNFKVRVILRITKQLIKYIK